jgi:ElaB/YqjD/DUF883 family membrane-anchored ribosome-binding protein
MAIPPENTTGNISGTSNVSAGARQDVGTTGGRLGESAKQLLERGGERGAEMRDRAMQRSRDFVQNIQTRVEGHPLPYIAGAFAGGILLGLWLRRR